MNQKWDGIERRKSLRRNAESMVASLSPDKMKTQPAEMLLHELLVHKIELEMQNDELQRAQTALEDARNRYQDLYEFAPVGYLTLNREDRISEINLTGATLLGVERDKLIDLRFSQFIAPEYRDHWHHQFHSMMEAEYAEKQALDLEISRPDGLLFRAQLDCRRRETAADTPPMLLIALTDIGKTKQELAMAR